MKCVLILIIMDFLITGLQSVKFIDTSGCGGSKGCWLMPPGCIDSDRNNSKSCDSIVTWSSKKEGIMIEIEGKISDVESYEGKYISMAFSYDDKMGEDTVLECVAKPDGTVSAYLSFNDDVYNYRMHYASKSMLNYTEGAVIEGRIVCRTVRSYDPSEDIPEKDKFKLFNLKNGLYTLMYAKGPTKDGGSYEITYHSLHDGPAFPWVATEQINVLQNTNINTMKQYDVPRYIQHQLVKVHGIFMLFAWWVFGAVAILLSRFFKNTWTDRKINGLAIWYQLHRGLMIFSLVLQCIAFAFVFIQAGDFKMCTFVCNSDSYALKIHTILGVTCTAAALVQPFMAWMRPKPSSSNRIIFNWLHWFVGTGSWIIATVTIFLSAPLGKSGLRRNFRFVPDYLMAGYISSYILVSIFLEMLNAYYLAKSIQKNSNVSDSTGKIQKSFEIGFVIPKQTKNDTSNQLQTWLLICFTLIATAIVIALTVLIATA